VIELDLVFLGFGNVARVFVRQLDRFAERLHAEGVSPRIVAIGTRRGGVMIDARGVDSAAYDGGARREPFVDGAHFIADARSATADAAGRGRLVLVETTLLNIENGRPAIDHVRAALSGGLHVITANKGPAAFAYHELKSLADSAHRLFRFEGAVMDGIPIFNLVRETLPCTRVIGFRGVINSTTNYILTEMERGQSFEAALADMQGQGIAEADPTLDVDGWDAAAKTSALANVLLDARMTPHEVERSGVRGVQRREIDAALAEGRRLRLISSAKAEGSRVRAQVALEAIPRGHLLAELAGMENALILETDTLGEIAVTELSAGLDQTAYGLFTDLVGIARDALR
jgi:homoserine dehydrogenase